MNRAARKPTSDYLLVDVSNSFTKIAFASRTRIGRARRIPTRELSARHLKQLVAQRHVGGLVVSSVVPRLNSAIAKSAGRVPVLFVGAAADLGVGVDYPNAETIGADRLANAAAVAAIYGCPAIVVDFGTAVTFDVVSAAGDYIGGVIAPGLEAMTSFLYHRTALLPKLTLREPARAVGKSTRGAMMAGAVFGYRGLVREIIARITAEAFPRSPDVKIVATGGYAALIGRHLPEIVAVHENLTLEGLRIIGNLNG